MAEEDFGAGEVQEAEKVLDVAFPARDEATGVVEPGKETLDFPAAFGAAHRPAILRGPSVPAVARDHLDAVLAAEQGVEWVAVIGLVADQARRERADEAGVERGGDEL